MSLKLRPRQVKAARLMAWGRTSVEIGKLLGVNRKTLSRWKKIPEFTLECEKVIREQSEEMRYRMANIASASVEVVWSELQDESEDSKRVHVALNMLKLFGIAQIAATKRVETGENAPAQLTDGSTNG